MNNEPMVIRDNDSKTIDARNLTRLIEERIKTLPSSGSRKSVIRIEIEVIDTTPLEWLSAQSSSQSIYWHDREDAFEMAGVGVADSFDDTNETTVASTLSELEKTLDNSDENVRYYGGMRFDPNRQPDKNWSAFGNYRFVLPRFELFTAGSRRFFICNLLPERDAGRGDEILSQLRSLVWDSPEASDSSAVVTKREDTPDFDRWREMIASALDSISAGRLEKIVLARKSTQHFDKAAQPMKLMQKLRDSSVDCFHFCFQPESGACFMGATPEQLYHRLGKSLKCEAIAGTRRRGGTSEEDIKLGEQLRSSDKDIREHRMVVDSIKESLSPVAKMTLAPVKIPESILKLDRVQHLITRMEWELNENTTDTNLLSALHPTPAVGGYPKKDICREIEKLETFDRGWYAGPVGWISKDETEFAVAIRSALLTQDRLSLFAGAGIVEGSEPEAEWEEIDNKMSGFMKVLS